MPDAPEALAIGVEFPTGVYSGAAEGITEELPEPSRVYEALVAAAAGGPWAEASGRVLVAREAHRRAVAWLEEHEPIGLLAPALSTTQRRARRYRWRASPVNPADTDFEPMSALAGPVVYLWPPAPADIVAALREVATEVTHVGRADSIARMWICQGEIPHEGLVLHRPVPGRGPGRVLRIPRPGRFTALEDAHAEHSRPGRHTVGSLGRQAPDRLVTGANATALEPRRFAITDRQPEWPFTEVWELDIVGVPDVLSRIVHTGGRVAAAVGVHRALIRAIGDDVPLFVTGRDGDGPLRGGGHLAIHLTTHGQEGVRVALAVPTGVDPADLERLAAALEEPLRIGVATGRWTTAWCTARDLHVRSAVDYWPNHGGGMRRTAVPFVVDVNGGPRQGGWTLDDAAVCAVGFAMRAALEQQGLVWGSGWAFRQELVRHLRDDRGVDARALRVRRDASRFVHRAGEHQLVVAAHALVDLGTLFADVPGGFLAIGRARHLGGGLLVPMGSAA